MATVNLSSLAPPTQPPAVPKAGKLTVTDVTIGVPNASSSGTVAVPVAPQHTLTISLSSPVALNTVTLNGVTPAGWSNIPAGQFASVIVDATGLWVVTLTTANTVADSVTIQGY